MERTLEGFVAGEIAVGFFDDDVALDEETLEDLAYIELGKVGVLRAEGDVLQI